MRKPRIAKLTRGDGAGDNVLPQRPRAQVWRDFFDLIHSINATDEFMADRPMNRLPRERSLFAES